MTKTIMILAIVAAFVGGTITTGAVAYAAAGGQGDNAIVESLNGIADAISGINPTVNVDPTPITNEITVDPASITVNAPQGEQGEQGIQGEQGPAGPAGTIKTYMAKASIDDLPANGLSIQCDPGDVALGGGGAVDTIVKSMRTNVPVKDDNRLGEDGDVVTGWRIQASENTNGAGSVYVICHDKSPFRGPGPIGQVP